MYAVLQTHTHTQTDCVHNICPAVHDATLPYALITLHTTLDAFIIPAYSPAYMRAFVHAHAWKHVGIASHHPIRNIAFRCIALDHNTWQYTTLTYVTRHDIT